MAVDYDSVFAKVILRRLSDTPDEQRREAEFPKRHGQLAPDACGSFALLDTYSYQRGHADVFREVYKQAPHSPPAKGERLLVVDIGAGAATVAVALGEALKRKKRERVDYLAFDPHPKMQQLGKQILWHLGAGFNSAEYVTSLEDVDFTDADRVLFTFSYVVHQGAVTPADIQEWASLIKRAVVEVDKTVELIYTTVASFDDGAHIPLKQMLPEAKFLGEPQPIDVDVPRRFPDPASSVGRILWEVQRTTWDVDAEHWILST